jgi:glycosyltransferase involved in cell wall biosynthesis
MSKVLIVSLDVLGKNMSGPGIRALAFARNLSGKHKVALAAGSTGKVEPLGFDLVEFDRNTVYELAREADVVVCQGEVLDLFPALYRIQTPLAIDLYDPLLFELLEMWPNMNTAERLGLHRMRVERTNNHLRAGDFFICASEKQRDFWLGMLAAVGRINPHTYSGDYDLKGLIDVVPFGLPKEKPVHTRGVLKGVHPGIEKDDRVLLWNGGIWNWLDPITLIRAMKLLVGERDDVKLLFMGTRHPNPRVPEMEVCAETIALSKDLGLYDRHVFYNEWTPYEERSNFLLEADFGICLHREHLETRYSFRTRILDCIWARLPIIISEGDSMSELVRREKLGAVVSPGDEKALKEVILALLDNSEAQQKFRANLEAIAPRLTWEAMLEPLSRFCENPGSARDKRQASDFRFLTAKYYLVRLKHYYREGGFKEAAAQVIGKILRSR